MCANACAALAQLLQAEDSQQGQQAGAAPLSDASATVLSDLTDTVHKRLGGLLGTALARFRWARRGRVPQSLTCFSRRSSLVAIAS